MPQISSQLYFYDYFGRWRVRWGIGRNSYMVPPGLYAVGSPGPESPVVVTANYKVTYDLVRSSLDGLNIWLLVLETFGINVWCAAGKGSFGTEELVRRVRQTGLEKVLSHRTLLLPMLGAPGVAAHEVARETGFEVNYAALRAADIPEYLDNGMNTTPAMRELTFSLPERLALVPVELVLSLKFALPIAALLLTVGWWSSGFSAGLAGSIAILGAIAAGTVAVPVLLPWLPGASFAFKGMVAGLLWSGFWLLWAGQNLSLPTAFSSVLVLTTVSSFFALNFTGSTPFTSRSGVRKEMRTAFPMMASALIIAVGVWIGAFFFDYQKGDLMHTFRYLKEVATLELDEEHCIGCRRCLEVCPHGVFAMRGGRARIIDRDACIECGACARNCPVNTVRVDAGVGCANALIIEWFHEKGLCRDRSWC